MYIPSALVYKVNIALVASDDPEPKMLLLQKQMVQQIVCGAPALPCVHTETVCPRWEIVCSTVDMIGKMLLSPDVQSNPELCNWLWNAELDDFHSKVDDFHFQGLSFFLEYGDSSIQQNLGNGNFGLMQQVWSHMTLCVCGCL